METESAAEGRTRCLPSPSPRGRRRSAMRCLASFSDEARLPPHTSSRETSMLQATLRRAATLVIALATLAGCDAQPLAPHSAAPALVTAAAAAATAARN